MKRFIFVAMLIFGVTPAVGSQGFIETGFHFRGGDYHPRAGIGLNGVFAFNRMIKLFHPEVMGGGWVGSERSVRYSTAGNDYAVARLDDTFTNNTSEEKQNAGLLALGRIVFDFDRTAQDAANPHTVVGFGVGGYQLFRKNYPAREAGALAEIFFRLHFVRQTRDIYFQLSSVRSFGLHEDDAINDDYPEFAYLGFTVGFEFH